MQLAQKLGDKESELTSARRQLNEAKETIERLERKCYDLEQVLENATQPGR